MLPQKISHYRILKKLGAGGMGDVFQAEDTKLGRVVALKLLPAEMASDPKRMRRFQQEAKAASSLSHPNIAHIYEIGESDGINFISMECIEGQTLQERIGSKALAEQEIIEIAMQVADTLAEAHGKSVVHRDIKPTNIMLTKRGQIKVLDFGLAKLDRKESSDAIAQLTTTALTDSGVVMGTVHYMSPEQALGNVVDQRTDIYSLGVVMYEMATGKRPFSGATAIAIVDQILHKNVEGVTLLNQAISPDLERIIFKCLRKNAAERYQTAAGLLGDLSVLKRGETVIAPAGPPEYFLQRSTARLLFVLLQIMYITFYTSVLRWSEPMHAGLANVLGEELADYLSLFYLFSSMPGIATRLYFTSMTVLDHEQTGVQFRKSFIFLFVLDNIWAMAPFGLSFKIGPLFSLACVPPLVFSPFSQRQLIASAYDMQSGGRRTTSPESLRN